MSESETRLTDVTVCPTCRPNLRLGKTCMQCAHCARGKGKNVRCLNCGAVWRVLDESEVSPSIFVTCDHVTCAGCGLFWVEVAKGLHRPVDTPVGEK